MITQNVSTLQIHKLTQAQYDAALAAGNIDENALYLTTDNNTYATEDFVNEAIGQFQECDDSDIEGLFAV